ncbi:MAG: endonuclease/exonuclease/phosphatase family protein [Bacteroidales bacterium]|nr:endonuclease/exonuclease/phosphatase family protein [Bacteroidales bacterium]
MRFFLVIFFIFHLIYGKSQAKYEVVTIGFYNLENLFDTINDPRFDDEEYLPTSALKWNTEKYLLKLRNMAEVISRIGESYLPGGPAILGVCEAENIHVLNDLCKKTVLSKSNYDAILFDSWYSRGVDVGLLYRKDFFKPLVAKPYRLIIPNDTSYKTRDQLLVKGILLGDTMFFIVNHWPSRRGGEKKSRPYRLAAAALTRHIVDSILQTDSLAKIFIMGDFNDDPTDQSVLNVLKAAGKKELAHQTFLYNPYYALYKYEGIGSHAYRDKWSLFDQIIVSKGLLCTEKGWQYFKAFVFNEEFLKQKEGTFKGYPFRTAIGGNFMGGYSDHFPSFVVIKRGKNDH